MATRSKGCRGCGEKSLSEIAEASANIQREVQKMDRLMPEGGAAPEQDTPKPLYRLSEREEVVVKDKMEEISQCAKKHANLRAELQGMLAVLRPSGSTSFDSDTLTFFE